MERPLTLLQTNPWVQLTENISRPVSFRRANSWEDLYKRAAGWWKTRLRFRLVKRVSTVELCVTVRDLFGWLSYNCNVFDVYI